MPTLLVDFSGWITGGFREGFAFLLLMALFSSFDVPFDVFAFSVSAVTLYVYTYFCFQAVAIQPSRLKRLLLVLTCLCAISFTGLYGNIRMYFAHALFMAAIGSAWYLRFVAVTVHTTIFVPYVLRAIALRGASPKLLLFVVATGLVIFVVAQTTTYFDARLDRILSYREMYADTLRDPIYNILFYGVAVPVGLVALFESNQVFRWWVLGFFCILVICVGTYAFFDRALLIFMFLLPAVISYFRVRLSLSVVSLLLLASSVRFVLEAQTLLVIT